MKLEVSKEAAEWYIRELNLKENDSVKFFGKVYGPHGGFSFALAIMEPSRPLKMIKVEGINFYVEKSDDWFFADKDLSITFDQERDEPKYDVTVIEG